MRPSCIVVLSLLLGSSAPRINASTSGRRHIVRFPSPPALQTAVLTPSKDNTLYQTADGSLSNGAGAHFFAGSTAGRQIRRALIAFDVAAHVPAGSVITRATLKLHVSQAISGQETMALRPITSNWGEGSSDAGVSRDGIGASSRPGDATWIHTFFPDRLWGTPGGDFATAADATAAVTNGDAVWESSASMVARVQEWLDRPLTNFGWVVLGNETTTATTKRFDSREIVPNDTRPSLTIEFTHP